MINPFLLNFYLVAVTSGRIDISLVPKPYREEVQKQVEPIE